MFSVYRETAIQVFDCVTHISAFIIIENVLHRIQISTKTLKDNDNEHNFSKFQLFYLLMCFTDLHNEQFDFFRLLLISL